jgi:hypothetical protein
VFDASNTHRRPICIGYEQTARNGDESELLGRARVMMCGGFIGCGTYCRLQL